MQTQKSSNSNSVCRGQNKAHNSAVTSVYCLSADEKLYIMEALDHMHVTRQYQEMGCCVVCRKISLKKCSGCGSFYCSSECQTFDWPRHKANCSKQRDCLSDRNSFASSIRKRGASSVKNFNDGSITLTHNSPFTSLANQLSKKSTNQYSGNKNLENFTVGNKQNQNKEFTSSGSAKDCKKINNRNIERKKKISPKKSSFSCKKSSPDERQKKGIKSNFKNELSNHSCKHSEAHENISSSNSSILSQKSQMNSQKIEKMEVIGTYRESPNRYWVMDVQNAQEYEEIQRNLNRKCENYEEITPKLGLVCGCKYADEWYRVKIENLNPEPVVHFIDFGNWSNCDKNIFKKLPGNLQSMPGLVFLIEFEEDTPDEYKTLNLELKKLIIEETSKTSDGIPRVKIIEGISPATTTPEKVTKHSENKKTEKMETSKRGSVMDTITANSQGMLFFLPGKGKLRFASLVPEDNDSANYCIEKVFNIDNPNLHIYEAKEGELVLLTDKEGNDQRGKVISKLGSTYFVQLIDCGNVISTEHVYTISEELINLIELGVKVTVEEIILEDEVKQIESCFFAVRGELNSGKWPCVLKDIKQQVIANVSLEKPEKIIEWRPQYVGLKSGSTVEITSVCSSNSFYVRSVDAETEQKFLDMNMEMIEFAPKAKPFAEPPLAGQLCCAKFKDDGCFYRAVVTSIEDGKIFVLFIDFGNEQKTDLKDLKPLSESLRNIPFFAVKVKLKNIFTKSWNNMIKDYIGKLLSENVELTLTYEKSINNGVVLREKVSGIIVNDFIEKSKDKINTGKSVESEFPLPKKAEIFLDDDLKYTTVNSESECVVALLYVNESEFVSNYTFWATIAESENFTYVNGELSTSISEHCTKVSTPYSPSFRELCLAEFEGSWYRAICAGTEGDTFKVFFVDFGNFCELQSTSIRKMVYEFLKAPALAMNCTLKGRDLLKGKPELTKKICRMLLDRINTLITGVTITKFEEDTFLLTIPEIDAVLSG